MKICTKFFSVGLGSYKNMRNSLYLGKLLEISSGEVLL